MGKKKVKSIKDSIPWFIKILVKIIFSRLPISNKYWHKIGLFRHGGMDKFQYSKIIFHRHVDHFERPLTNASILEMGPGNSVATGVFSYLLGCRKTYLIDHGDYITRDMLFYRNLLDNIEGDQRSIDHIKQAISFDELCSISNIEYFTNGLDSLKLIPDKSIDFIFSNAVLEHIRKKDFQNTIHEMHRILKEDGISSHEIDLRDHLNRSLNHLRFSERIWESKLFVKSGFYTNRIRFDEMMDIFKSEKFIVKVTKKWRWNCLPISRDKLKLPYRYLKEEDLKVYGFHAILKLNK